MYKLQIHLGGTIMNRENYLNVTKYKKEQDAYERFIWKILTLLGAEETKSMDMAKEIIQLETELAKVTLILVIHLLIFYIFKNTLSNSKVNMVGNNISSLNFLTDLIVTNRKERGQYQKLHRMAAARMA